MSSNHYQQQTQFKAHGPPHHSHQQPVKVAQVPGHNDTANSSNSSSQVQRKLSVFFCVYAILILALYLTYAAYYYYQHHNHQLSARGHKQQQPQQQPLAISEPPTNLDSIEPWKQELEARFMFVEKLVNVLTLELQETQRKLAEREKCDCQMSCTFNGTRYADRSSWQNQCDTCTCQSGIISCLPRKCPPTSCDDPIQLPGHCCPVCMKRCKYNGAVIKHGQKFTPQDANKECKCQDGRIVCEQAPRRHLAGAIRSALATANLTTSTQVKTVIKAGAEGLEAEQQRRPNSKVILAETESLKAINENQMSAPAAA